MIRARDFIEYRIDLFYYGEGSLYSYITFFKWFFLSDAEFEGFF